ncbi:hypothetical protein NKW46_13285 [Acetobacter indonesiensis]|uniref:hypothetical protein n=1 Tax=Acetobacter indonesiensis TaxID=104101 RepID=UPI0020A37913|nr:hypothetical protein [Acetobacter indonesiensis]MCP1232045.1 hypothetical protein [Acetobacter indonesiensis]
MSETDPVARAFEDLCCAEMTVRRRSVEALPQAWRDEHVRKSHGCFRSRKKLLQ